MLAPLLSGDPMTFSVLVKRFCVMFISTIGGLSSNPLLLRMSLSGIPLTSQLIKVEMAVQLSTAISLREIFMACGGTTISVGRWDIV